MGHPVVQELYVIKLIHKLYFCEIRFFIGNDISITALAGAFMPLF